MPAKAQITRKAAPRAGTGIALSTAISSWRTSLEARNLSPKTIASYMDSLHAFTRFYAQKSPRNPRVDTITAEDLRKFIADQLSRLSDVTAKARYTALGIFFRWLLAEDELEVDPMARVEPPMVAEKIPHMLSNDEIGALLKSLKSDKGLTGDAKFRHRRDAALLWMYLNTGLRLSELANMKMDDLDAVRRTVSVIRKGRREATIAYGPKTGEQVDRYLRVRKEHREAGSPWLWLGKQGRLTSVGVGQMISRRGVAAGIERAHAHAFRHSWAADRMRKGLADSYLAELGGWRDLSMLQRYGKAVRGEHAREANLELPEIGG